MKLVDQHEIGYVAGSGICYCTTQEQRSSVPNIDAKYDCLDYCCHIAPQKYTGWLFLHGALFEMQAC